MSTTNLAALTIARDAAIAANDAADERIARGNYSVADLAEMRRTEAALADASAARQAACATLADRAT